MLAELVVLEREGGESRALKIVFLPRLPDWEPGEMMLIMFLKNNVRNMQPEPCVLFPR